VTCRDVLSPDATCLADEIEERILGARLSPLKDELHAFPNEARFGRPQSARERLELAVLFLGQQDLNARHQSPSV